MESLSASAAGDGLRQPGNRIAMSAAGATSKATAQHDWSGLTPLITNMGGAFTPRLFTAALADFPKSNLLTGTAIPEVFSSSEYLEASAKEAVRQEFVNMSTSMATASPLATSVSSSRAHGGEKEEALTDACVPMDSPKCADDQCVPQQSASTPSSSVPGGSSSTAAAAPAGVPPGTIMFMMMPPPYFSWPPSVLATGQTTGVRDPSKPETSVERKERLEREKQELVRLFKKKTREAALVRFRQKRRERRFGKHIRYDCRKKLADARPRVKGRFVRAKTDDEKDQVVPSLE